MRKFRRLLIAAAVLAFGQKSVVRLELISPSPITDQVILDIRGAVENNSNGSDQYDIALYLDASPPVRGF